MRFLYTSGIYLYGATITLASVFNSKAKRWKKGRKNWKNQLPNTQQREVIWFHCASLGEFDQGLPLMELFKKKDPDLFLLVTFFSPSGFEHYHKRNHCADHVCYLPLDTPSNALTFIRHFNPKIALFVKYEFWGNLILEAKQGGARVVNVSGLFRPNQPFFKWHGGFFRKILRQFDWFFVQNECSGKLLTGLGLQNVQITGDTRFDRVLQHKESVAANEIIEAFKDQDELIIIGSSWPQDEEILIPWINETEKKILIAPHNVDDAHIQGIVKKVTRPLVRYTQCSTGMNAEVLILDTIGHLASAYRYGTIAYVGGGFSGSLHNILEPAVFGLPVIFGPKHTRFPEAGAFIQSGFGFSVSTTEELRQSMECIEEDYAEISQKESEFVEQNAGASQRIFDQLTSS